MNNNDQWPAAFRGSLLSSIIGKHIQYVGFADRRAQGMIVLCSVIIPVSLSGIQHSQYCLGAVASVLTCIATIACLIASLYPKQYIPKSNKEKDLFHFSHINSMSEQAYMDAMKNLTEERSNMTHMAARELYHISTKVITPKFTWLRRGYIIFFTGNVAAILLIGLQLILL